MDRDVRVRVRVRVSRGGGGGVLLNVLLGSTKRASV